MRPLPRLLLVSTGLVGALTLTVLPNGRAQEVVRLDPITGAELAQRAELGPDGIVLASADRGVAMLPVASPRSSRLAFPREGNAMVGSAAASSS